MNDGRRYKELKYNTTGLEFLKETNRSTRNEIHCALQKFVERGQLEHEKN